MKTLKSKLIVENKSRANIGNLEYAMLYKNFRTWLLDQSKGAKFITVGVTDDMNLQDLNNSYFSDVYYNKEEKIWVGNIEGDEIPFTEWSLSDNDIILIWEV